MKNNAQRCHPQQYVVSVGGLFLLSWAGLSIAGSAKPTKKFDPFEACIAQENKSRVELTPDEKAQLDALEQKDNKARALRVAQYLLDHPGDYAGASSFIEDLARDRREKVLFLAEAVLKEWKTTAQKSCSSSMSEETFRKLKKRHDSYEEAEDTLRAKRSALLDGASSVEQAQAYLQERGIDKKAALCFAAGVLAGFIFRSLR